MRWEIKWFWIQHPLWTLFRLNWAKQAQGTIIYKLMMKHAPEWVWTVTQQIKVQYATCGPLCPPKDLMRNPFKRAIFTVSTLKSHLACCQISSNEKQLAQACIFLGREQVTGKTKGRNVQVFGLIIQDPPCIWLCDASRSRTHLVSDSVMHHAPGPTLYLTLWCIMLQDPPCIWLCDASRSRTHLVSDSVMHHAPGPTLYLTLWCIMLQVPPCIWLCDASRSRSHLVSHSVMHHAPGPTLYLTLWCITLQDLPHLHLDCIFSPRYPGVSQQLLTFCGWRKILNLAHNCCGIIVSRSDRFFNVDFIIVLHWIILFVEFIWSFAFFLLLDVTYLVIWKVMKNIVTVKIGN